MQTKATTRGVMYLKHLLGIIALTLLPSTFLFAGTEDRCPSGAAKKFWVTQYNTFVTHGRAALKTNNTAEAQRAYRIATNAQTEGCMANSSAAYEELRKQLMRIWADDLFARAKTLAERRRFPEALSLLDELPALARENAIHLPDEYAKLYEHVWGGTLEHYLPQSKEFLRQGKFAQAFSILRNLNGLTQTNNMRLPDEYGALRERAWQGTLNYYLIHAKALIKQGQFSPALQDLSMLDALAGQNRTPNEHNAWRESEEFKELLEDANRGITESNLKILDADQQSGGITEAEFAAQEEAFCTTYTKRYFYKLPPPERCAKYQKESVQK